jgi:hypothetical protein
MLLSRVQPSPLERYTPLANRVWAWREPFCGMVQTEFREFLLFLLHRKEFRLFSLLQRVWNGIPRVPSIFFHGTDYELFSFLRKGSEQNSESFLFCKTARISYKIPICSNYSVFHGIIFLSEIPNPSSESPWYPSGELRTVFGMAAHTLSDETIKFFLVQWYLGGKVAATLIF